MAAGMGSRYGGIKQIEPIGTHNELIIDYSIYDAVQAGFSRVVFVIRRDIEKDFCESIFNRIKVQSGIKAEYVFQDKDDLPMGFKLPPERTKPWGTTHAILAARNVIGEPFAVVNADDFYGREAFIKIAKFFRTLKKGDTKTAMVGYKLAKTLSDQGTVSRGVSVVDKNNFVTSIDERYKIKRMDGKIVDIVGDDFYPIDEDALASMNFFGFSPEVMPMLADDFAKFIKENINNVKAESPIPTTLNDLLKAGKITMEMFTSNDKWLGFTYPEDKVAIQGEIKDMVESGIYPSPLWGK
jgi:NDP-sugar pyrophosphorylase family protein